MPTRNRGLRGSWRRTFGTALYAVPALALLAWAVLNDVWGIDPLFPSVDVGMDPDGLPTAAAFTWEIRLRGVGLGLLVVAAPMWLGTWLRGGPPIEAIGDRLTVFQTGLLALSFVLGIFAFESLFRLLDYQGLLGHLVGAAVAGGCAVLFGRWLAGPGDGEAMV